VFSVVTESTVLSCKDIEFTPPKGEVDDVPLLGTETTTVGSGVPITGTFQNMIHDEKSYSSGRMTCTMVLAGDNTNLPDFLCLATGSGLTTVTNTYKRHTFGDSTNNQSRNLNGAISLDCNNGTEDIILLMNAPVVNIGSIKPTGMDGHFEIEFEAISKPKDIVIEEKI